MSLSSDLISQFTKTINEDTSTREVTTYGTIVDSGGTMYVQLDGSDLLTPMEATTEVNPDDRVMVTVRNHTASVTGNLTDPSIGIKRAGALETGIIQTAEEIKLYAKDEDAKLQASITITASEIRSEVSNEVAGLNSAISQTAGEIRATITDEVNKLSTEISANGDGIKTLVEKQDDFSEFQQTVEGFSFMGKGGSVKISGGDITLTGSISWTDFDNSLLSEINTIETTANSAKSLANSNSSELAQLRYDTGVAISKAESAQQVSETAWNLASQIQLPYYLQSTYIDATTIISPSIVGGVFYAIGQTSWLQMTSSGIEIYTNDISAPKITIANYGDWVQMVLGAGDLRGQDRLYINKFEGAARLEYCSAPYNSCGFVFNENGTISLIGSWA